MSREVLDRVSTLAMAYRLFGDQKYLDRAVDELRAVCAFEDWNPSHFLDVAEMSMAVATGYDWLYGDLDEATRREIAAALRKNGLDASRQVKWWIKARNNWNQVCHASILAAALALAEENPAETARFAQRAIDCLPIAMAAYAPKGNFPEGPGYWSYATEYNVLALKLLEGALGNDFGLASLPGFRETAHNLDFVTGLSGKLFNYADSGDRREGGAVARVERRGLRAGRGAAVELERREGDVRRAEGRIAEEQPRAHGRRVVRPLATGLVPRFLKRDGDS